MVGGLFDSGMIKANVYRKYHIYTQLFCFSESVPQTSSSATTIGVLLVMQRRSIHWSLSLGFGVEGNAVHFLSLQGRNVSTLRRMDESGVFEAIDTMSRE
jgi:hypothetical protein